MLEEHGAGFEKLTSGGAGAWRRGRGRPVGAAGRAPAGPDACLKAGGAPGGHPTMIA
ncbi:hypothetical protein ANK1_0122 [plant metagenome]|uniref:Uncharacterized protein n=1 Tax=plant metagenome TaxID=1297885 RepID=A0A484PSR5_9ZZZZ